MKETVWFALVGLKPLEGNDFTPNVKGVYTRIACKLSKGELLDSYLNEVFEYYFYEIFEITDIQSEDDLSIEVKENNTTRQLLSELNDGSKFAWGTFHTW